jgi:hypothetical protein
MNRKLLWLVFLPLAVIACSAGDAENPNPSSGWAPLGEKFFTGNVQNNYSIAVHDGTVGVGYWDVDLGKPCVKTIAVDGGAWAYLGGGPVPVDALALDPLSRTTFKFREDQGHAVIGFNRSMVEPEFVLFAADAAGSWQQLPSLPLDLLPGYPDQLTYTAQDFDFAVKDGAVFAVVSDVENTAPDTKTCLSVFAYQDGNWALLPDRICEPRESDGFGFVVTYDRVSIQVSDKGRIYLGYFRTDHTSNLFSLGVSMHDGGGWTTLADASLYPIGTDSYATTKFGMQVLAASAGDELVIAVGGLMSESHVFSYRAGSWSKLPDTGIQASLGTRIAPALQGSADCIYLAYQDCCTGMDGLTVQKHGAGAWNLVGDRNFTDDAAAFYDQVLDADESNLYLCFQTNINYGSPDTRGTLSVYRHRTK